MKKLYLIPIILGVMFSVSCSGGSKNAPKQVADKFMNAFLINCDLDEVRKYISEELYEDFPEMKTMTEFENMFFQVLKSHTESHGYGFVYNAGNSEIHENEAKIYYTVTAKANPAFIEETELDLRKNSDGKWLITDYYLGIDSDSIDANF